MKKVYQIKSNQIESIEKVLPLSPRYYELVKKFESMSCTDKNLTILESDINALYPDDWPLHYTKFYNNFYEQISNSVKESFIGLNADGNDKNLATNGHEDDYWYSVGDGYRLLLAIRKSLFEYTNAVINEGEAYASYQENIHRIFLSDPYYGEFGAFVNQLEDDVYFIATGKKRENGEDIITSAKPWTQMPTTIIIPILTGTEYSPHWRSIKVNIDYANKTYEILFDDPYGVGHFPQGLKTEIIKSLQPNIKLLIETQNNEKDIDLSEPKNQEKHEKQQNNGYDCGPITFSNIQDYVKATKSNELVKYTIPEVNKSNHDNFIKETKAADIKTYSEISGVPIVNYLASETENNRQQLIPKKQKAFTPLTQSHSSTSEKKVKKENHNLLDTKNVIKVMDPLTFNDKGHITALKFGKYESDLGRESYNIQNSSGKRYIENFKISWNDIPEFAIITGANGCGKSYLLELIIREIEKSPPNIKFTYIGSDDIESFNSSTSLNSFKTSPNYLEHLEESVFNYIIGNPDHYKQYKDLSIDVIRGIVEHLLNNDDTLKGKETKEIKILNVKLIKDIVAEQCRKPNLISSYNFINPNIISIFGSALESYRQTKEHLCSYLKDYSRILDEPYDFWKTQHPDSTIEHFKIFLKDKQAVNDLIEQYINEKIKVPNVIEQVNKLLKDFPYKLIEQNKTDIIS